MRTVLLIAYHFPPLRGSSGIQRALRFAQYLPEFGWRPIVLTTSVSAYESTSAPTLSDIPSHCRVYRAWTPDASRHLAIAGRYPALLARPDRWRVWGATGAMVAAWIARRHSVDAIWSTYPIASAHVVGARAARLTRRPWVADFRDPMAQDGYPADPLTWASFRRIETEAAGIARALTFTSPGAREHYRAVFPDTPPERFQVLENGFDEPSFGTAQARERDGSRRLLLHSGIVYPSERDPTHLFEALGAAKRRGALSARDIVVRFRASTQDALLRALAIRNDILDLIELAPPVPYGEALAEMLVADALLLLQAANCNAQIPAKLYEYFRAQRPILALTDSAGDTANRLRRWGYASIAPLDDAERIEALLLHFVRQEIASPHHSPATIESASRRGLTRQLADLLDQIVKAPLNERPPGRTTRTDGSTGRAM